MNIARAWYNGGCSVVPIRTDGTKRPSMSWTHLQTERLTETQVTRYWDAESRLGVAVICGAVSGDLEMTEIEADWCDSESLEKVAGECARLGVLDVWESLTQDGYAEWSPAGGLHVMYRLDGTVPGNTKLASTPDGKKTKAETRGEGGYTIVAPTPGYCHPSGEPWTTVAGARGSFQVLTMDERDRLHAAITAALDESPPPPPPLMRSQTLSAASGDRPGDDYNNRVDWPEILEPHGWRVSERRGAETLWVRPGKSRRDGHSASTGYANDADRMYVWSTSAGLPTEQPLSKFYVYTELNHGGDFRSATRALSGLGFGAKRELVVRQQEEDWVTEEDGIVRKENSTADSATQVNAVALQGEVPPKSVRPETLTDSGNADLMLQLLNGRFRYVPQRNKWLRFDSGVWTIDHQGIKVLEAIDQEFQRLYREAKAAGDDVLTKHFTACLSQPRIKNTMMIMRGRSEVFSRPEEFDAKPEILNLDNATVDLTTGNVTQHNPIDMLTKKMGVGYNPTAKCERWLQFLKEVLPSEEAREFLQRLVGYSLTGEPVERALVLLYGPGGTGKSKLIETLTQLFGSYGTTAADSLFRSKRDQPAGVTNDLNDLKGARLASVSELDAGIRMDEALIKRLTGFDTLTSRGLYEENTSWRPQCVIWLATNHLPRINGDDGAIWDRLKVITMDRQIPFEERDPHLLKKLLAEKDGIFNWMLEGLAKYRALGLRQPESSRLALESYKQENDPVGQFIEEELHDGALAVGDSKDDRIAKSILLKRYQAWSRDQGQFPMSRARFNSRMFALGYEDFKSGTMFWRGLRLDPQHSVLGTM